MYKTLLTPSSWNSSAQTASWHHKIEDDVWAHACVLITVSYNTQLPIWDSTKKCSTSGAYGISILASLQNWVKVPTDSNRKWEISLFWFRKRMLLVLSKFLIDLSWNSSLYREVLMGIKSNAVIPLMQEDTFASST